MSACPASCADLAAPSDCDRTFCMEGCKCAEGFVMSEASCVPYSECGCDYLGRYYPVRESGQKAANCRRNVALCLTCCLNLNCLTVTSQLLETFVTEDCSKTCQCTSTGVVCQANMCQEDHECTIYDSKRDCFRGQQFAQLAVVIQCGSLKRTVSAVLTRLSPNTAKRFN